MLRCTATGNWATHYKINIICQFKGFLDMMAWCEGQMMVIGANTVQ